MARKLFRGTKPDCLSATVAGASERALVRRFKSLAKDRAVSVQKLLLEAVRAFLDSAEVQN